MQCSTCKREMANLFLSAACDHCDFGPSEQSLFRGFVVLPEGAKGPVDGYVFRASEDAERWRVASGREEFPVREVFSLDTFRWHLSRGTLQNVVLADHMFTIFPDHRFERLPHRAFFGKTNNEQHRDSEEGFALG